MSVISRQFLEKANAVIGKDKYKSVVVSANHIMTTDEPKDQGGQDSGMNPFSLLLSALASCTLSTLRGYADRKDWPLEGAEAELILWKVEDQTGRKIEITRDLNLIGPLGEEQKNRLLQIAKACAVSKILEGETVISTTVLLSPSPNNNSDS
jgi:putative redox protein